MKDQPAIHRISSGKRLAAEGERGIARSSHKLAMLPLRKIIQRNERGRWGKVLSFNAIVKVISYFGPL